MGKTIENIPPLVVLKNIDEKELDRKRVHIEVLFEQTGFDKRTNRRHACETQRNYNGQIDRKTRKRKKKYWRNLSKNRSKVWHRIYLSGPVYWYCCHMTFHRDKCLDFSAFPFFYLRCGFSLSFGFHWVFSSPVFFLWACVFLSSAKKTC